MNIKEITKLIPVGEVSKKTGGIEQSKTKPIKSLDLQSTVPFKPEAKSISTIGEVPVFDLKNLGVFDVTSLIDAPTASLHPTSGSAIYTC